MPVAYLALGAYSLLCRILGDDPGFYSQALLGPYHFSWGT